MKTYKNSADLWYKISATSFGVGIFTPEPYPKEPEEYTIYCSIPCGQGHDDMTSTLIVK